MRTSLSPAVCIAALIMLGCSREDGADPSREDPASALEAQAQEEIQEAVEAVKALAEEKVEQFRRTMEAKSAAIDRRIDELKRKAEDAAAAGQEEWEAEKQKLAEKRDALQKKLDGFGSAAEGASEEMAAGLNAAYEDLEAAVEEAARHFGPEETSGSSGGGGQE